jgi:hypothetical protein
VCHPSLQQQHSQAMGKNKVMSKKIEKLEEEIAEQENTIINFRKNNN